MKSGMKAVQFVHQAFDISGIQRKLGDREHVPLRSDMLVTSSASLLGW
jgi:hypothetical protein